MPARRPDARRFSPALAAGLLLAFAAGAGLSWAIFQRSAPEPTADSAPLAAIPAVSLQPLTFADIPGWADDQHADALAAFRTSCASMKADDQRFARFPAFGPASAWATACAAASKADLNEARAFFEAHFTPFRASDGDVSEGKVTGYYEPELKGSRTKSDAYPAPVYPRPSDLVTVDPEGFRALLRGERMAGRVSDGVLRPYPARAEIERDGLSGHASPILYLPSVIDAFFLQIQGSGRVLLAEGGAVRLNYAAQNGRPYTAIGGPLIAEGAISREAMSMQAIRVWLAANPDRADAVMNLNESYVFFRELPLEDPALGPPGAEGVSLTPGRSLAVDSRLYPYGLPIFMTARGTGGGDFARLMIAQDTGGAIRGVVRGDIFFGWGTEAERAAGSTNAPAGFVVLVPK